MSWEWNIVNVLMWYVLYCNSLISELIEAFCAAWGNQVNYTKRFLFFSFFFFLQHALED